VRITFAASPLAGMVNEMASEGRETLVDTLARELTAALNPCAREGDLTFPQRAHVLLSRKQ
jgi:hypothetical protein